MALTDKSLGGSHDLIPLNTFQVRLQTQLCGGFMMWAANESSCRRAQDGRGFDVSRRGGGGALLLTLSLVWGCGEPCSGDTAQQMGRWGGGGRQRACWDQPAGALGAGLFATASFVGQRAASWSEVPLLSPWGHSTCGLTRLFLAVFSTSFFEIFRANGKFKDRTVTVAFT